MRRRTTPYSRLTEIRASRRDLLILVLVTLALGLTLSLVSDATYDVLVVDPQLRPWIFLGGLLISIALILAVIGLLYSHRESETARIEMWIPYHLPGGNKLTIVRQPSYQVTAHARRALVHYYREREPRTREWLNRRRQARTDDIPFPNFILDDHVALSQCLLLYALHRAGEEMLGREACFGWWGLDLPARAWMMDDLPEPLGDNPFLRADQRPNEWRLLLPAEVTLTLVSEPDNPWPRWILRHRRYGQVEIHWRPCAAVAGRGSQVWRVLTQHLRLGDHSELHILNARLEARAYFRWTLLPRSDPFHRWATGLLARLEEALDWGYFLQTRPARILANLDWKIGWWERDDSLVDALARIERRLDDLEMSGLRPARPEVEND